jgi:hypothetical protein
MGSKIDLQIRPVFEKSKALHVNQEQANLYQIILKKSWEISFRKTARRRQDECLLQLVKNKFI